MFVFLHFRYAQVVKKYLEFILVSSAVGFCSVAPLQAEEILFGPNTQNNPNVDVALGYINRVWIRHDPVKGFEEFVAADSRRFPGKPGGSDPKNLAKFLKGFPAFKYSVKQVFADGPYVIVHSYLTGVPQTGAMVNSPVPGTNPKHKLADEVVDIYKVVGGKIVLHWDVVEPATETADQLFGRASD